MRKDSEDKEYYIDYSRDLFDFLVEARQWTGFDTMKLNRWINNFQTIENGEYYACKILNRLIGYSENDIFKMLTEGIGKIVHKETVLPLLISRDFSVLESEIDFAVGETMDKTLFAPLLVNESPGESSVTMMRILTQREKPRLKNTMFISNIPDDYPCDILVIVDDCIGSGEQFAEFWEEAQIKSGKFLRTWCHENNIHAYYLCLVAFDKTIATLQETYDDITIVSIEQITDKHRIFNLANGVWDSEEELDEVKQKIESIIGPKGINLLGYRDMDFGVVIHNNIPDWSLPILHKQKNDWKLLVERKDSND